MTKRIVVLVVRGHWVWIIFELMVVQVAMIEQHGVALLMMLTILGQGKLVDTVKFLG